MPLEPIPTSKLLKKPSSASIPSLKFFIKSSDNCGAPETRASKISCPISPLSIPSITAFLVASGKLDKKLVHWSSVIGSASKPFVKSIFILFTISSVAEPISSKSSKSCLYFE